MLNLQKCTSLQKRLFSNSFRLYQSRNHYELLGVDRNASQKEIKTAYYSLAKKFHPDHDHNGKESNKEEQMAKVNDAYSILSGDQSRKEYDDSLRVASQSNSQSFYYDQTDTYRPEKRSQYNVWNEYFHHFNIEGQKRTRKNKNKRDNYNPWEDYNPYDEGTFQDFDDWERAQMNGRNRSRSRNSSRDFYDYMNFRESSSNFTDRNRTSHNDNTKKTTHSNHHDFYKDFGQDYQFSKEDPFYHNQDPNTKFNEYFYDPEQEFHNIYNEYEEPFTIFEQYNLDPNHVAEDFYQNYSHLFSSYQEFEQYLAEFNKEEEKREGQKKAKKKKSKKKKKGKNDEKFFNFPYFLKKFFGTAQEGLTIESEIELELILDYAFQCFCQELASIKHRNPTGKEIELFLNFMEKQLKIANPGISKSLIKDFVDDFGQSGIFDKNNENKQQADSNFFTEDFVSATDYQRFWREQFEKASAEKRDGNYFSYEESYKSSSKKGPKKKGKK